MLVTPDYVRLMARYNRWQNDGLRGLVVGLPDAELRADRGAFWGSILGTLNHLLWGDQTWLSRFAGTVRPDIPFEQAPELTRTAADWAAERVRTDDAIARWAEGLQASDLAGDLTWTSGILGREMTRPVAPLVVHFFNHQTHHRGQVHAMLTAAGARPGDTDLFLMPTP